MKTFKITVYHGTVKVIKKVQGDRIERFAFGYASVQVKVFTEESKIPVLEFIMSTDATMLWEDITPKTKKSQPQRVIQLAPRLKRGAQ